MLSIWAKRSKHVVSCEKLPKVYRKQYLKITKIEVAVKSLVRH
jgi:hypothetical protein